MLHVGGAVRDFAAERARLLAKGRELRTKAAGEPGPERCELRAERCVLRGRRFIRVAGSLEEGRVRCVCRFRRERRFWLGGRVGFDVLVAQNHLRFVGRCWKLKV
jgi:hypothetical protein